MYPGAFFVYESCCPLESSTGTMGGHFTMVKKHGEKFNAVVPTFTFLIPKMIPDPRNSSSSASQTTKEEDPSMDEDDS